VTVLRSDEPTEGARAESVTFEVEDGSLACDLPLVVWEPLPGVVRLANERAAALFDLAVADLVGRQAGDLIDPRHPFDLSTAALVEGGVDAFEGRRRVMRADGGVVPVTVWTRSATLEGRQLGVTLVVPTTEQAHLGGDPGAPWRDLAPIAVGAADPRWRVRRVSGDIATILGGTPAHWVGVSLPGLVHPDDRGRMPASLHGHEVAGGDHIRLRRRDGTWVTICLLGARSGDERLGEILFALIGPPPAGRSARRVVELERRLRRIGTEVRAAGLLDDVGGLATSDFPRAAELSTRQQEILGRLLQGERVSSISNALFLSPSTVRNHLAKIFAKLGVHSQSELIELLRPHRDGARRSV
jgi:DNA-binding CsgD family transcriptional regulator